MKVLMINGSPNEKGCTYTALSEVAKSLNKNGVEIEIFYLGKQPISGCIACRKCATLGKCIINDQVNTVAEKLAEFDGLVVGSPVYYGSAAGQLCCFLDRLFYSCSPKDKLLALKPAAAVVSCRRGGATAAFQRLNMYFSISNMFVIGSQYWNQVHGRKPEDVEKDMEGLQTMRTLGENMAYAVKSRKISEENSIATPKYEKIQITDFIQR